MFNGHSGGALWALQGIQQAGRASAEETRGFGGGARGGIGKRIREDDGAVATGVHDILDANGNTGTNDLLHGEGMDDFRAVKGQLGGLGGRDGGQQAGGGHLARVCREDTVDFLPDLQLVCLDAHGDQGSAQIGIAASDGAEYATWHIAKEASNHGDLVTACSDLAAQLVGEGVIESLTQAGLARRGVLEDFGDVDILGGGTAVVEQGSHVAAGQLLAAGHDQVFGAGRNLAQVEGRVEDADETLALVVNVGFELDEQGLVPKRVACGLLVVEAQGLHDVDVGAGALLGGAGAAKEAVGGALELGVAAAGRADNGGTVGAQAVPVSSCVSACLDCHCPSSTIRPT